MVKNMIKLLKILFVFTIGFSQHVTLYLDHVVYPEAGEDSDGAMQDVEIYINMDMGALKIF